MTTRTDADAQADLDFVVPFPEEVAAVAAGPWPRPMRASDVADMIGRARSGGAAQPVRVGEAATRELLERLVRHTVLVSHPARWWHDNGLGQLLRLDETVSMHAVFYARPQDIPDWYDRLRAQVAVAVPTPPPPKEDMITTTFETDDGEPIYVIHDGDFVGEVIISLPEDAVAQASFGPGESPRVHVRVPFEALQAIVARKVRDHLEQRLASMSDAELLGVLPDLRGF